ncbi:MAG: NAD(+)/NADH kinase [Opitutales bacterium]|nr:NAD(+)/NADH kinase [Opitutales bacterium]
MKISRIAIVWNRTKAGAEACAKAVAEQAGKRGMGVLMTSDVPVKTESLEACQLCCVIGGDGTILGAVASAVANNTPIFGINLGKLGYLASYEAANIEKDFEAIIRDDYRQVSHTLLECTIGAAGTPFLALNDIVIKTKDVCRLATLRVEACGCGEINTFRADGLIFSTSTGSTAYSLSAGGPLIHSEAEVFAMTPLNPHTLTNRTIVLPRSMHLQVFNENENVPVVAVVDGRILLGLPENERIFIRVSTQKLTILQPRILSEFEILRTKLKWV